MSLVATLLAASLFGADAPGSPVGPMITYQVRYLELTGLEWRSAYSDRLTAVTRQGGSTVWTAPSEAVAELAAKADRVVTPPKLSSSVDAKATVYQNTTRKVVAEVARGDGANGSPTAVGFAPKFEDATEGFSATVSGRPMDQGVLANVAVRDKRITAVHNVAWTEPAGPAGAIRAGDPVRLTIQVPEVSQSGEVGGEWMLPKGGALVVSLGAHTAADADGRAVVRERLAVVEAWPSPAAAGPSVTVAGKVDGRPRSVPEILRGVMTTEPDRVVPASPRVPGRKPTLPVGNPGSSVYVPAAPRVPSRSLPVPVGLAGETVSLPPLPDEPTPPTAMPNSSEPCATPQTRTATAAKVVDREAVMAGLTLPAPAAAVSPVGSDCCDEGCDTETCPAAGKASTAPAPMPSSTSTAKAQVLYGGRTITLRVPGTGDFAIELKAHVVPTAPMPKTKD